MVTRLFYWFFESRNKPSESPTVVYFQGGPGCSSIYPALSGNGGPCVVDDTGNTTSINEYSWNTHANVLYLDQPAGVGFSRGRIPTTSVEAAESTLLALNHFFRSQPKYNTRVFLAGLSYAGHYIPPLVTKLKEKNSPVRLEGIVLGNPIIAPEIQWRYYPRMLLEDGIIKQEDCNLDKKLIPAREDPTRLRVTAFMNSAAVRRFFGVYSAWQDPNWNVHFKLSCDVPCNYHQFLPDALNEGLRILVYAGDRDLMCNWMGNLAWMEELHWKGAAGFRAAVPVDYRLPNGKDIGDLKSFTLPASGGQLVFIRVKGAGHSVAVDAPQGALRMLDDFLNHKL
ncbi:hypothetical protein FOL46_000701 [Perkinsus olseni]|nr:hypothetical protein FOL46_000701 [Perkinsus olseni]